MGRKVYELSNHLGNVLATVSDKKLPSEETQSLNGNPIPVFDPLKISYEQQTNTLTKLHSVGGWNAGGHSDQTASGNCYIEFTVTAPIAENNGIAAGLSYAPHVGEHYNAINYSWTVFQNNAGAWRANGYKSINGVPTLVVGPESINAGDVLRVSRVNGKVRFEINNSLQTQVDEYLGFIGSPVVAAFSIRDEGSKVSNLFLAGFSQIVNGYTADVLSFSDYYPFGMQMPGRHGVAGEGYRYGFQGQELDNEIKGNGNSVNYKFRMHDSRLGRFFAVDPLSPEYPFYSPYAFSGNRVIDAYELEGLEPNPVNGQLEGNFIFSNQTGLNNQQFDELAADFAFDLNNVFGKYQQNGNTISTGVLTLLRRDQV